MNQVPVDTIAEAFSRTAEKYDAFAADHPHLTRMRDKVYSHVVRHVAPGARILELNAGTGTDAVQLAQRGYHVHATDIAPGMLNRLSDKVERQNLHDRVTMEELSFLSIEHAKGAPFDAVFSDLGGLNCVPDLTPVIQQLPKILKPGGIITWVLMPHICLWEMAEVFRGNFSLAFRRWARGRVRANLEGLNFDVYYFSPRQVIRWFGKDFQVLALEGLSIITPTAESKNFAKYYPRLYGMLSWLDDKLSPHWPWNAWGDFYILTVKYVPV
ncbi:MAG TPA: methyltransferase domain-containing protein [Anaerolineales bacterium]|nr:methyltransferase domain-containing protein [Anaerolineales bacterium]